MRQRDVRRLAAQLGIPESQVSRDVLISHVLNALADEDGIIFYGGTALGRIDA